MNKATIFAVILLAVIAVGAVLVQHEMKTATERPAVQRQLSQSRLAQLAAALGTYREAHQAWPDTTARLLRAAKLPATATLVRGAGVYRYRPPAAGAPPETVVMWSDRPHDGVKVGEPWGGEGQHANHDVPPVAFVITADGKVRELTPDDWARRIPVAPNPPTGDTATPAVVPPR